MRGRGRLPDASRFTRCASRGPISAESAIALLLVLWEAGGVVGAGSTGTVCYYDSDCNQRGQCGRGTMDYGKRSTCRCLRDLLVSNYPQCYEPVSVETATLVLLYGGNGLVHAVASMHMAWALYDLLAGGEQVAASPSKISSSSSSECLRGLVERLHRLLSLKAYFLTFALTAAIATVARDVVWLANMFDPHSHFRDRVVSPSAPYQVLLAVWIVSIVQATTAMVCIWVRVAARLHDPHTPAKNLLWRLILATDGTGAGLLIWAVFTLPFSLLLGYCLATMRLYIVVLSGVGFGMVAGLCLLTGAWLIADARAKPKAAQQRQKRPWFVLRRRRRGGGPGTATAAAAEGISLEAGLREQDAAADTEDADLVAAFRDDDYIDSVSSASIFSGTVRSMASVSPLSPHFDKPAEAPPRKPAKARGSKSCSGSSTRQASTRLSSSSPQSQPDLPAASSELERKMRRVRRSAHRLAARNAVLMVTACLCFAMYVPLDPFSLELGIQCFNLVGFICWLLATLNCLYYLSPRLRESVAKWSESDNCLLSCIGVLVMPDTDDDGDEGEDYDGRG